MTREPDRPGVDGYTIRTLVMESAKENQEWCKCLPATCDLPTTHEHCIEHKALPDGRMVIEVTVTRRAEKPESDNLNALDEGTLEVQAAQAGLDVDAWKKLPSKAKKVKAIRDAKKTTEVHAAA